MLKPLFNKEYVNGKKRFSNSPHMHVAGFMSGNGTNLVKILEREEELKQTEGFSPYEIVFIFSNNSKSHAVEIGKKFNKPVFVRDIKTYYKKLGLDHKNLSIREKFDRETLTILRAYKADCIALAGYMSVVSYLITDYLTINVHPADLSIVDMFGKRRYQGLNAVKKAIKAEEEALASTSHIATSYVDSGPILLIGPKIKVDPLKSYTMHQTKLKEQSDWKVYPLTLELIAKGMFNYDSNKKLYLGNCPIPNGVRL